MCYGTWAYVYRILAVRLYIQWRVLVVATVIVIVSLGFVCTRTRSAHFGSVDFMASYDANVDVCVCARCMRRCERNGPDGNGMSDRDGETICIREICECSMVC